MIAYRCFLCSVRIDRKHVEHPTFINGRRHVVRLCYGCGLPEFNDKFNEDGTRGLVKSCQAVDAKLREIKTLEV